MSTQFYKDPESFDASVPIGDKIRSLVLPRSYIKGLDINRNQKDQLIDAKKIKQAGYDFAILEACWGLWEPPTFKTFWPPLLDAGIVLLVYGFFRGDQGGADQANFLLEVSRKMFEAQGFTMPPGLDVERWSGDTSTLNKRQTEFYSWVGFVKKTITPLIYSNVPSWKSQLNDIAFPADCLQWSAHYNSTTYPILFGNCPRDRAPFHQFGVSTLHSWCPPVPGMSSDVGVDRFYGTLEQLITLGNGDIPEPPTPEPDEDKMKEKILARIDAMKVDLAEDVAELDVLREEVAALPVGTTPPPPPPPATTRKFVINSEEKSLAHFYKKENAKGKPIMIIYEDPRYIYGDKKVWANVNSGSFATITMDAPIAADGSNPGPWYRIADKRGANGEVLYIDYRSGKIA